MDRYAEIIVLNIKKPLSYINNLDVLIGDIVTIPLKNRYVKGVVYRLHNNNVQYKTKNIFRIIEKKVLSISTIKLVTKISRYYLSPINLVLKLFLPSYVWNGFGKLDEDNIYIRRKLSDYSVKVKNYYVNPAYKDKITGKQKKVIDCIGRGAKEMKEIINILGLTNSFIRNLVKKGLIIMKEEDKHFLEAHFSKTSKFIKIVDIYKRLGFGDIKKNKINKIFGLKNSKIVNEMKDLGLIEYIQREDTIKNDYCMTKGFLKTLNAEQERVFDSISEDKINNKFLVKGITGSGKTEIYLHLIYSYITKGKQCILLIPEISLTPQIKKYFERVFGAHVSIMHSRLTKKERSDEWRRIKDNKVSLVIGSRSALFVPARQLGLIIIDEEHEWTYKQVTTPCYHTRKVAEMIADDLGIKLVLGSATPDIESYYKTQTKEYILCNINKRAGPMYSEKEVLLPEIKTVDLRKEFYCKNRSIFSRVLKEKILERLQKKEQVILFLNRRGAHSSVVCRECGHVIKCDLCDVSLTHHNYKNNSSGKLLCHHCGRIKLSPEVCPNCRSVNIKFLGIGTQRVEEEIHTVFPDAKILRVDRDTTDTYEEIYNKIASNEVDIIIGTQIIAKGFDFPNVTLVSGILAETTLNIPDYKSAERLFQLLIQVSGRAGRGRKHGEVILQTYAPRHYVFSYIKNYNYEGFYDKEINLRKEVNYPPFTRCIKFVFSDIDKKKVFSKSKKFRDSILEIANKDKINIYFAPALIPKIYRKYFFNVIIRGNNLDQFISKIEIPGDCRIDVDPINLF